MEMAVLSSLSSKEILAHLAKWSIRPSRGDQYGLWDLFLKMSLLVIVVIGDPKQIVFDVESH